jgi:hypothetical protein
MFSDMFDFPADADNYQDRAVAHWTSDDGTVEVDTCRVSDGHQPIETAVIHPEYNDGAWMIVEAYPTVEQAQAGHERWVELCRRDALPAVIADCCNAKVASFASMLAGDDEGAQESAGLVYRRTVEEKQS